MISTRSVELVIDTVVCLTLAKWETVSGQFGGYLSLLQPTGYQPQNREGARPHRAAHAARPRRRGDRIRAALLPVAHSGTKRPFYACRRMSVHGGKVVVQRTSPQ